MKQLMIIGTDTDVGKTYVSGLILKKLHENGKKAAYFKAAMSGNIRLSDGMLEIVEPGFDARAWRSPPNEKAFIVFMSNEKSMALKSSLS